MNTLSLQDHLLKIQFKLDHMSLQYRIAVLSLGLLAILGTWYFLIYGPQTKISSQIQQQIQTLNDKTLSLQARYDKIMVLVTSNDTKKLLSKYTELHKKMYVLDQQIKQFNNRYISDKNFAKLLHAILKEVDHVKIQHFATIAKIPSLTPETPTLAKPVTSTPPAAALAAVKKTNITDVSYYSLVLNGDYFAILSFLQHIEQLKWQIFWTKLDYQIIKYPEASATIEFYTLKPALMLVGPGDKS